MHKEEGLNCPYERFKCEEWYNMGGIIEMVLWEVYIGGMLELPLWEVYMGLNENTDIPRRIFIEILKISRYTFIGTRECEFGNRNLGSPGDVNKSSTIKDHNVPILNLKKVRISRCFYPMCTQNGGFSEGPLWKGCVAGSVLMRAVDAINVIV